jgi:hypothetical protein
MRRALAIGGIVASSIVGTACTPNQIAFWFDAQEQVAATPDPQDDVDLMNTYLALPDVPDTPCSEWFWTSIEAGWAAEEWWFLAHILPRESNCDPAAYNRSGASGLAQIMPMWADDCGITRDQLFDPLQNLRCAKHVYNVQGKSAWQTW